MMAIKIKAQRGTQDVLPRDSYKWQAIEREVLAISGRYGFKEIRTPTFEATELFTRSVGDTTDVVQKEMYTFEDKGGRSITLRPEGTSGVMRAAIENGLLGDALPVRLSYVTSCFRYEKPQAGRLREFHQFGVEMLGAESPAADAQVISLGRAILDKLGVTEVRLEINSIGCPHCRPKFLEALRSYFAAHEEELCETCKGRLERNPMRILDCKSPVCQAIAKDAPIGLDYLCDDCKAHFEGVKNLLDAMGIAYEINPRIVRGLDYYVRTVFEFVSEKIGAQGTVCGGGRYDGLIGSLGGNDLPGIGFGMGLERLLMLVGDTLTPPAPPAVYLIALSPAASLRANALVRALRERGIYADCDVMGRALKAQMKYADKTGAKAVCVLGDDELASGQATLKWMETGATQTVALNDLAALAATLTQGGEA